MVSKTKFQYVLGLDRWLCPCPILLYSGMGTLGWLYYCKSLLILYILYTVYTLFYSSEHREHTELRVPTSIVLEIVPGSVQAWCHVQGLAHNPRVRLSCPLQRPLSTILVHLQQKWRNARLKLVSFLKAFPESGLCYTYFLMLLH